MDFLDFLEDFINFLEVMAGDGSLRAPTHQRCQPESSKAPDPYGWRGQPQSSKEAPRSLWLEMPASELQGPDP